METRAHMIAMFNSVICIRDPATDVNQRESRSRTSVRPSVRPSVSRCTCACTGPSDVSRVSPHCTPSARFLFARNVPRA